MPARPDPTNALRQRRHRLRKKALAEALAGDGDTISGNPDERLQVRGAIAHLQLLERRHANEAARHTFASTFEANAAAVAQKLIELALAGDATALTLVTRSMLPAARAEDRRINLELPPLDSHANLTTARQRVGAAVAAGELGLDEAERLMRLLESVETSLVEGEKRRLLEDMRAAMAGTHQGGVQARISLLAREAEILVEAARRVPAEGRGDQGEVIEAGMLEEVA